MDEEEIIETVESHEAEISQLKRMIEENKKQIDLGNDVIGRQRMLVILENEISNNLKRIEELKTISTENE